MPKRSPFTTLCGRLSRLHPGPHADLHVHTTASDGDFTPSQVVAFARQAGLQAVAITDHDTLAGIAAAQEAAGDLEVVAGVEISAAHAGREVHLLGYFVWPDNVELNDRLAAVCDRRRERFWDYVRELTAAGLALAPERARQVEAVSPSLGRRHVAGLLIGSGAAKNSAEAFHRFLGPLRARVRPKLLVPIEEAIRLVHEADGVSSLAHPPSDLSADDFRALSAVGLNAVEAEYPWGRRSAATRLREVADGLGLAVTGGSDCHGPHPGDRRLGAHGIDREEFEALRRLSRDAS